MNKKQAGIIVTLLALIVCAGILAARVNGPLQVTSDGLNEESSVFNWGKKDTTENSTDTFVSARTTREVSDSQTISTLKDIIDNKNVSQENKAEAINTLNLKTKQMDFEARIEQTLKLNGFEDVICLIEQDNSKARVIVKGKEITEQQRKKIQDVVTSISNITKVEIENRQ